MPKDKIGSIRLLGRDDKGLDIWYIQVQVGSNKNRQTAFGTIHGSRREAELLAAQLKTQLIATPKVAMRMTLDEYFNSIFIPNHCDKVNMPGSKPLARATVKDYKLVYERWISPAHGSRDIADIDESDVRGLVERCTSKRGVLRTYRVIMNKARADCVIPRKLDLDDIQAPVRKMAREPRWSASEILLASKKLKGIEPVELFLLIGSSGLRMEEVLALTPRKLKTIKSMRNGRMTEHLAYQVDTAYTDIDGMKATKTEGSVRLSPAVIKFAPRILEIVESMRPTIVQVSPGCYNIGVITGYGRKRIDLYETEEFEGTADEADKRAREIDASRRRPGGNLKVKVEPSTSGWVLKIPTGCRYEAVRNYEHEVYQGSRHGAEKYAMERWMDMRLIPMTATALRNNWRKALAEAGLRKVPPSFLRKSSENLMISSNVPVATVQKIHGHATFSTDYKHYYDIDLAGVIDAAEVVGEHLMTQNAHDSYTVSDAFENDE